MPGAAPLIAVTALFLAAADVKNPALAEGIRLYEALDYAGALQSLTQALDKPSSRRDYARIHLYIGLIQHRYKLVKDAEASFTKALDYEARVRIPRGTTSGAKALFRKIQQAKLGDEPERAEPERKKKRKVKRRDDEPDDNGIEYISSTPVSETRTSTEAGVPLAAIAMAGTPPRGPPASSGNALPGVQSQPPRQEALQPPATQAALVREDSDGPIAAWIALGVGVAAVATGVTLGVLAAKNASDANAEPVANRAEQLHATAVQQQTLMFVSFGASGAALGLSAFLFLTD